MTVPDLFHKAEQLSTIELRKLFAKQKSLDIQNPDTGQSLLSAAVNRNNAELVSLLLELGSNPNFCKTISPPLHLAAGRGNLEIVKLLVDAGIEIDALDENGDTALMCAVATDHPEVASYLLNAGANTKLKDQSERNVLTYAAEKRCLAVFELLKEHFPARERRKAELLLKLGGQTEEERENVAKLLKMAGVGSIGVVRGLIESDRLEVDSLGQRGETPLIMAANFGRASVVKFLIDQGANVNHQDAFGNYALLSAASNGHGETFDLLFPLTETRLSKKCLKIRENLIKEGRWNTGEG